jgi:hypothetical protein
MLPAGKERIRRAEDRASRGDTRKLPLRWLSVTRGAETFSVAVGPVDHGGPDEELAELVVTDRKP